MKINKYSFFKLLLLSTMLFLIFVLIMDFFVGLISNISIEMIIDKMTSRNFIIRKVVIALVSGFIITYMLKRKPKN